MSEHHAIKTFVLAGFMLASLVSDAVSNEQGGPVIRSGQRIAFVGGMVRPQTYDYDRCIARGLKANGITVNTLAPRVFRLASSATMRAAFHEEILQKGKTDWLILAVVSDKKKLVLTEDSTKKLIEDTSAMVDAARNAGCRVLLVSSGICFRGPADPTHAFLAEYNSHAATLAKAEGVTLVDLHTPMKAEAAQGIEFRGDFARMNPNYHTLLASLCLQAMGLSSKELDRAKKEMGELAMLEVRRPIVFHVEMTLNEFRAVRAMDAEHEDTFRSLYAAAIKGELKPAPAPEPQQVKKKELPTDQACPERSRGASVEADVEHDVSNIAVRSGEKVVFLGDSITAGRSYISPVVVGLKANGIEIEAINAGISGHTAATMLARVQRDVIDKKPDWMLLNCGVNDAARNVSLDQYSREVTEMVERAQAEGIRVMLLAPTICEVNPEYPPSHRAAAFNAFRKGYSSRKNLRASKYAAFMKDLAEQKKLKFADLYNFMDARIKKVRAKDGVVGRVLTVDSVHMNPAGNAMMAEGILMAFGLNEEQMARARHAHGITVVNAPFRYRPIYRVADYRAYSLLTDADFTALTNHMKTYILGKLRGAVPGNR